MWHAYNLIREGDQVTATTFRKVQQETSKGSESERVKIRLTIHVEHVDFDPDGEGWAACMGTHGGVCAAHAMQAVCLQQCLLVAMLAQEGDVALRGPCLQPSAESLHSKAGPASTATPAGQGAYLTRPCLHRTTLRDGLLALQARRSACAARTWQRMSMSSWGPTTRWRLSSSALSPWPSTSGTAWTWTASGRPATLRHPRTWQQC